VGGKSEIKGGKEMNVKRLIAMSTSIGVFVFMLAMPVFAQHGGGGGGHMGGAGGMGHGAAGMGTTHGKNSMSGPAGMARTSGKSMSDLLSKNTKLSGKLEGMLGLSGPNALTELQAAGAGFKNLGQFVAAVHVSHNLGIPFDQFRNTIITGDKQTMSLGAAIHKLKPDAEAKNESKKATTEANDDLKESSEQG
jgi:hypothetical protein